VLKVEGIEVEKNPGAHYEIYLGLPKGAKADFQSVHYVGNLTFFGLAPPRKGAKVHDETPKGEQSFDVTAAVRELRSRQLWDDDKATATFVRRGLIGADNNELKPKEVVKVRIEKLVLVSEAQ
jgi:hypothetical protein